MLAKLIVVILSIGLTAAGVLVLRQQRLEAAYEMTQVHREILQHQRLLWQVRTELAAQSDPDRLRALVESLDIQWVPIPEPPMQRPDHNAPLHDRPVADGDDPLIHWLPPGASGGADEYGG